MWLSLRGRTLRKSRSRQVETASRGLPRPWRSGMLAPPCAKSCIASRSTCGQALVDITAPIGSWLGEQRIATGLLTIFCRHTSASLLIQENADPDVRADLETFFRKLVPEGRGLYAHESEGPDDMPSDIRAALTTTQLSVPVVDGHLRSAPGKASTSSSIGPRRTAVS